MNTGLKYNSFDDVVYQLLANPGCCLIVVTMLARSRYYISLIYM